MATQQEPNELVETLVMLGLDPDEARLYLQLNLLGPSKASDVSKVLKISRAETYRKLQRLVERGFASATLHRPTQFIAQPPTQMFQNLLEAQETLTDRIRSAQEHVSSVIDEMRADHPMPAHEDTFRIITGRREFYRIAAQMARRAQSDFKFLSTNEGSITQSEKTGLWSLMVRRAKAGLPVSMLGRSIAEAERKVETSGAPVKLRELKTETPIRFAIADGRELIISVLIEPTNQLTAKGDISIHTDAADFVGTLKEFFDITWNEESQRDKVARQGLPIENEGAAARLFQHTESLRTLVGAPTGAREEASGSSKPI